MPSSACRVGPSFETARLVLRPLSLEDLPALAAMLGDPDVMRYSIRGVCDRAATRRFIEWCQACHAEHGYGPLAMVDKRGGELVGFCGISPEEVDGDTVASLGYRLARRYWHQGLAAEAADAVLEHAFDMGLAEVVAIIEPEHRVSIRVVEKVGFRDFSRVGFHDRPVRLYRMKRPGRA